MLTQQDIDDVNALLLGVEASLSRYTHELETFSERTSRALTVTSERLSKARDDIAALEESGSELRRAVFSVLARELDDQLRPLTESLAAVARDAAQCAGTQAAIENLTAASHQLREIRDDIAAAIWAGGANLEAVMENLVAEVTLVGQATERQTTELIETTQGKLRELSETVSTEVFAAIDEHAEAAGEHWQEAMNSVQEKIDVEMERLADVATEQVEAVVHQAAQIIREGLSNLRKELQSGDEEGQSRRAELQEAVDTIKRAIPPLNAAFKSFQSLAGTVGMGV